MCDWIDVKTLLHIIIEHSFEWDERMKKRWKNGTGKIESVQSILFDLQFKRYCYQVHFQCAGFSIRWIVIDLTFEQLNLVFNTIQFDLCVCFGLALFKSMFTYSEFNWKRNNGWMTEREMMQFCVKFRENFQKWMLCMNQPTLWWWWRRQLFFPTLFSLPFSIPRMWFHMHHAYIVPFDVMVKEKKNFFINGPPNHAAVCCLFPRWKVVMQKVLSERYDAVQKPSFIIWTNIKKTCAKTIFPAIFSSFCRSFKQNARFSSEIVKYNNNSRLKLRV